MYEHTEIHPNQIEKLYDEIRKLGEPINLDAYREAKEKELVAFLTKIFELHELAFQIYLDWDNLDSRNKE
jgi:hypothetical protein